MGVVGAVTVMCVLLFVLHVSMVRECEGARVTAMLVWGWVVVVSAGHECVGGTRGSSIASSAADVLGMRVMRRVGGVCDMCMCLAQGGIGDEKGEWIKGLGLGFTNPVGTGEVVDVCLCLGCSGVCGEWVGGLDQDLEGCAVVMSVSCDFGFFV